MAKKGNKKDFSQQEVQNEATVDTQEKKSGKNNLFIDRHRSTLIHDLEGKDGKTYKQVNYPMSKTDDGQVVWGKFLVQPGQVLESTKTDKDGNKTTIPGFNNILLGTKGQHYQVSFNAGTADNPDYQTKEVTCADIKAACDNAKKAYYAEKNAKTTEAKGVDAPEAAEAEAEIGDEELE